MDFIPVRSTNLEAIGSDPETQVMGVRFVDGSAYEYDLVPQKVYDFVRRAPSVGKIFASIVKNNYLHRRVR